MQHFVRSSWMSYQLEHHILMNFLLVSIFNVICLIVSFMPNKFFGWLQAFGSMVKIVLFFFIIGLSIALIAGAGPTGQKLDGSSWRDGKGFQNGFTVRASWELNIIQWR